MIHDERPTRRSVRILVKRLLPLLAILHLSAPAAAQGPDSLRLRQAYARLPEVVAYVDLLDQSGGAIAAPPGTSFAATIGADSARFVSATAFAEAGEGIAYIFLLDVSRSLTPAQFEQMRQSLGAWVDEIRDIDRVALLIFGSSVRTLQAFTANKDSLQARIQALQPTDGDTQLYSAIATATDLAQRDEDGLPLRRVAILFSDGDDDSPSGLSRDEARDAIQRHRLPLYTLGYMAPPRSRGKVAGLQTLAEFARRSGGAYVEAGTGTPEQIERAYAALRAQILGVTVLRFTCERCVADRSSKRFEVRLATASRRLSDGIDIRMIPSPPGPQSPTGVRWWLVALVALAVASIAFGIWLVMRRKPAAAEPTPHRDAAAASDGMANVVLTPELQRDSPVYDASLTPEWDESRPATEQPPPPPPVRNGRRIRLSVLGSDGRAQARDLVLTDQAIIGRTADAQLSFPGDHQMSARHCELVLDRGAVLIRDLESRNGTAVNGIPLKTAHRLEDGDLIEAGETRLRVHFLEISARQTGSEATRMA